MSTHTVTDEQVIEAILQYKNASETVNPKGKDGCLYVGPGGKHCLGGQVLVDLGIAGPGILDAADRGSWTIRALLGELDNPLSPEATDLLVDLQMLADGTDSMNYEEGAAYRRVWSSVVEILDDRGRLALDNPQQV